MTGNNTIVAAATLKKMSTFALEVLTIANGLFSLCLFCVRD